MENIYTTRTRLGFPSYKYPPLDNPSSFLNHCSYLFLATFFSDPLKPILDNLGVPTYD